MHTEFRRAITAKEIRSLVIFDHKAFDKYPGDWFDRATWQIYEPWWMLVGNRKIGCCAFASDTDFEEDIQPDKDNPRRPGSLYVASTGILPGFRGMGFGTLLKAWQLSYGRYHGFSRIVTNTRENNRAMVRLNQKFGFRIIRITAGYYEDPREATVVMERRL
jgi:ribosomal protein S18 acetylase RimI-like enzyme